MSYEPTNWKTGDIVTSQKLNKLENGVANAGGVMVVHEDPETGALDKTYAEIEAAEFAVLSYIDDGTHLSPLSYYGYIDDIGYLVVFGDSGDIGYGADTKNDYPVHNEKNGGGQPNV